MKLCFDMHELQIFLTFACSMVFKHKAQVRSSLTTDVLAEFVWNLFRKDYIKFHNKIQPIKISLCMEIHLKVRRQKLMTADAVQRKLQSGFIFHIVSLNVLLKFIDIVN